MNSRILVLALALAVGCAAPRPPEAVTPDEYEPPSQRFTQNDILGLVYRVYGMMERHVPSERFTPFLIDQGLRVELPDETLTSLGELLRWYSRFGAQVKSQTFTLSQVVAKPTGNWAYHVELNALWEATERHGGTRTVRTKQMWTVLDRGGEFPVIAQLIIQVVPNGTP